MAIKNPHAHAAREAIATLQRDLHTHPGGWPVYAQQQLTRVLDELVEAVDYEPPRPSIDQTGDPEERATAAAGVAHLALLDLQARLFTMRHEAVDADEQELIDVATSSIELVGSIGIGIIHALRAAAPGRRSGVIGARIGEPRPAGGEG